MDIPFHLPPSFKGDLQVFNAPQTVSSSNLQWQCWTKPRGCTMMHAIVMGAGAGGGGGFTRTAAAAGGGGGGGGSGGITRVTLPLILVPDVLYIQAGMGGRGVASGGGAAGNGLHSIISTFPNNDASNMIAISGSVVATGGGTGTGAAVGSAGAGSTVTTLSASIFAGMGQWSALAGQAGGAGGAVAGAIGTPVAFPATGLLCMGGPGGAGTTNADFAGGIITGNTPGVSLISDSRPQGSAAGSNDGSGGWLMPKPFFSYCGLGGSSSNAGIGGNGGPGGPGSGGGGGGAGTTGGRGGDGGPGLVWILCW